jgi:hypothetical protein
MAISETGALPLGYTPSFLIYQKMFLKKGLVGATGFEPATP